MNNVFFFENRLVFDIFKFAAPEVKDLINWSLVNKQFCFCASQINPIIYSDEFSSKFTQHIQRFNEEHLMADSSIKETIELFRRTFVRYLLLPTDCNYQNTLLQIRMHSGGGLMAQCSSMDGGRSKEVVVPTGELFGTHHELDIKTMGKREDTFSCKGACDSIRWEKIQPRFLNFLHSCNILGSETWIQKEPNHWTVIWLIFRKGLQKEQPSYPIPKPYSSCILSNRLRSPELYKAFHEGKFSDCMIKCQGGQSFGAHRLILALGSPLFNSMFSISMKEGIFKEVIFSEVDLATAKTFISYFYNAENPFNTDADKIDVDAVILLELAHRYEVMDLVDCCAQYIGLNSSEDDWQEIGQLGLTYENVFLLQTYDSYRLRRGESLSPEMKEVFKKLTLPCLSPLAQNVCCKCDVGFGNKLGIRFKTNNDIFQSDAWKTTSELTWTKNGWIGLVPTHTEFKFVRILPSGEVEWEVGENRTVSDDKSVLEFDSIKFGKLKTKLR